MTNCVTAWATGSVYVPTAIDWRGQSPKPLGASRQQRTRLSNASVRYEAVYQAGATRGLELVLTAVARAVRGIPGLHMPRILKTLAIVMADNG